METVFEFLPNDGPLFLGIAEGLDVCIGLGFMRVETFRWFCLECAPRGPRKTPPEEPEFIEGADKRQASIARENAPLSTASSIFRLLMMSLSARDRLS